jgi:uncharacterized membrane protein
MRARRIVTHLFTTQNCVARAFPRSALSAIESAIQASEATQGGEIRLVVEGALDGRPLWKGQSPRARALELFSELRVWDTEHNNGLLIYLLLADRAVEIVADRGIAAHVPAVAWRLVCQNMEAAFKHADFIGGVRGGIEAVTAHLALHFPVAGRHQELPDAPLLL